MREARLPAQVSRWPPGATVRHHDGAYDATLDPTEMTVVTGM
ncbi:hypothetical protein SAZ10_33345 [Mesorhizobium sp. BAC0120]|nr:hypothetical protein [Mesorhizobium sp. BAC0120]MDW6026656.1 hypothetical protein [Mesorhizobium sp. BAC0120]